MEYDNIRKEDTDSDGSTTFNVPDLRETVPVGTGTSTRGVTAHDTYELGQFKDDQLQAHTHYLAGSDGSGGSWQSSLTHQNAGYANATGAVQTARTGTTTHGKQLGVNYIIKAKQVAVPFDVKENIKAVVEDSTDFADFKTKIAEW